MNNVTKFIRQKHERDFTIISNIFLKDKRLSAKSKWIFAYMLSLPDDWVINISEIINNFPDWRESINSWIKQLEQFWYFKRNTIRNNKWEIKWIEYIIIEKPIEMASNPLGTGFPITDNPITDNQQLLSTNILQSTNNTKVVTIPLVIDKNIIDQNTNKTLSVNDKNNIDQNLPSTTSVNVYKYYADAFPKKKGHAKKLWTTRITELLKSNTEEDLKRAVDNYKKDKLDTIKKQEWTFIKTAENFFWYEKWTKIRFIERYLQEEEEVKPKKELPKSNDWMWWLEEDTYNLT